MVLSDRLRVGATGHRFLAERDKLAESVNSGLDTVLSRLGRRPLEIVSSLAEGADRLIAEQVLRRPGSTMTVPLPLARADYETDFRDPESRAEFRRLMERADRIVEVPAAQRRSDAYMAAGRFVVEHCDVLFAIWDGKKQQGHGGTAMVVELARTKALPLVWIHAGNAPKGSGHAESLGADQGRITYEGMP